MKSALWFVAAIAVPLAAFPACAQQSRDGLIDLDNFSKQRFYEVDGQLMTEQQKRAYEVRKAEEMSRRRQEQPIAMGRDRESDRFDRASPLMGNPVVPPPR